MCDFKKHEKKIILDDWLTTIIGKPVYHLQNFSTNFEKKDLPKNQMFIWSKVPVDDIEKLTCLQNLGFYLVDTNIQFSLSKKITISKIKKIIFLLSYFNILVLLNEKN